MSTGASLSTALVADGIALAGRVILFWDYIITFDDEYRLVWKAPWTKASLWFYLNRYVALLGHLALFPFRFNPLPEDSCNIVTRIYQLHLIVTHVIVGVLMALRVYAIYERARPILYLMIGCVVACVVGAAVIFIVILKRDSKLGAQDLRKVPGSSCLSDVSKGSASTLGVAFTIVILYDSLLTGLLLRKSWLTAYGSDPRMRGVKSPLLAVIARDGSFYFVASLFINIINIITCFAGAAATRGSLTSFSTLVSVTLMSRMSLNLRKATSPEQGPTTFGTLSALDAYSTGGNQTTATNTIPSGTLAPFVIDFAPAQKRSEIRDDSTVPSMVSYAAPRSSSLANLNAQDRQQQQYNGAGHGHSFDSEKGVYPTFAPASAVPHYYS
ncbi:hypothetical protein DL96DRAFT_1622289 [Flagelloscypha sp. PMI_526]|nr:hypothetical protein DL96DRAFT_1622289 [Flagelloscypha sp. PMI_526]